MILIKGAVFNVLAITTVLLHESPQNTKYVPISPGDLISKVRIEDRSGINHSYKVVDSHKRTYFLKEMSPLGLNDGDFSDDEEEETNCINCLPKSTLGTAVGKIPESPLKGLKLTEAQPDTKVKKKFRPNLTIKLSPEMEKGRTKNLPIETIVENEVDSSRLAAYITDGLVPQAQPYEDHRAIVQEYLEMDKDKTDKLFHHGPLDFKGWTHKEKEQLFTHMLADLLLKNTDAHFEQFGIDAKGNLVGFDKGKSNLLDRHSSAWERPFGISDLTFSEKSIYSGYVDYLQEHKEELNAIIHSDIVTKAFQRVAAISPKLDDNQHSPTFAVPPNEDPIKFRKFYKTYSHRFRMLKHNVYGYFQIPLPGSPMSPAQSHSR
ncbi:MAG: hypothetical protein ABIQ95_14450 [Bdellovibrionia bacterium]